jgi:asparagine synthase (glutamine-hydrolysing)
LPIDEPVFYRRASDYTDRFLELLETAVTDRLRTSRVGVFMSGGVDSTSLAAMACRVLRRSGGDPEVRAFTTLVRGVADGKERHYAHLVADHLGMPIFYRVPDEEETSLDTGVPPAHTPEPAYDPTRAAGDHEHYRRVASYNRVCFYGEGPDNALEYEWRAYLEYLLRERRYGRLIRDVCSLMVLHRRIPLLSSLPRRLKGRRTPGGWQLRYPEWLNADFERRLELPARWAEWEARVSKETQHPVRPAGYGSFNGVLWEAFFRDYDAELMRAPLEVRHPFVDLRLLRYMLSVPAVPWCREKYLLRRSMRGIIPWVVLRRHKASVSRELELQDVGRRWRLLCFPHLLARFVDIERIAEDKKFTFAPSWRYTYSLSCWLTELEGEQGTLKGEVS